MPGAALFIIVGVVIIAGHSLLVIVYKGNFVLLKASKVSDKSQDEQIAVVAEFHAYKIAPHRIAYRTGIDIDLINNLIKGEFKPMLFRYLLKQAKLNRREQRLKATMRLKGSARHSLQNAIEQDFKSEISA